MKDANLVKLCLPEPPTPTSKALPLKTTHAAYLLVFKILEIKLWIYRNLPRCIDDAWYNKQMDHSVVEEHQIQMRSSYLIVELLLELPKFHQYEIPAKTGKLIWSWVKRSKLLLSCIS